MNNKYALPKDGGLIADEAFKDLTRRYEKIALQVYENEYVGVRYAADNIVSALLCLDLLQAKPLSVSIANS